MNLGNGAIVKWTGECEESHWFLEGRERGIGEAGDRAVNDVGEICQKGRLHVLDRIINLHGVAANSAILCRNFLISRSVKADMPQLCTK